MGGPSKLIVPLQRKLANTHGADARATPNIFRDGVFAKQIIVNYDVVSTCNKYTAYAVLFLA